MADVADKHADASSGSGDRLDLDKGSHPFLPFVFAAFLAGGLGYGLFGLFHDIARVGEPLALGVFGLLAVALFVALGFEFVNGFHDTANAVATVIYTHSLPPIPAVIWSGFCNFVGVVLSSGAVAYTIVNLLPVDLILQVGSAAGYAMIFALLLAAVVWNLATWFVGIPNSSTHCLIGSILGVGLANQLMTPKGRIATSGVEWGQAIEVSEAALLQPDDRLCRRGDLAAGAEALPEERQALEGAGRRQAAALGHPFSAHLHLHRGQFRPRRQRRAEGHGPDHADPDRRGAHRFLRQPHHERRGHAGLPQDLGGGRADPGATRLVAGPARSRRTRRRRPSRPWTTRARPSATPCVSTRRTSRK